MMMLKWQLLVEKYLIWLLLLLTPFLFHQFGKVDCCLEEERLALLELEAYMNSYYSTDPWSDRGEINCCKWSMVRCNVSTGRVTKLLLNSTVWRDDEDAMKKPWLFNVTLFRPFSQLIYLDLSWININGLVEDHGSTNISTLKNLRVLKLDYNNLGSGHISVSDLTSLRTLSISYASLNESSFPLYQELSNLWKLRVLDLGNNYFSSDIQGPIPSSFSNLKNIESLDLSFNNLSGNIPSQLVELNTLEIFNVSYNNLSGRVPVSGQFGGFDESNYRGNFGLFGFPGSDLHNQTRGMPPSSLTKDGGDGDQDETFVQDFLWSFGMSCATIFLATIAVLHINPRWRQACFDFVDWYILWWLPMSWRLLY